MKVISCCIRKVLTSQGLSQLTCHPSLPLLFCSLTASPRELPASPGTPLPRALWPCSSLVLDFPSLWYVHGTGPHFLCVSSVISHHQRARPDAPTASLHSSPLACFIKLAAPISRHVRHLCEQTCFFIACLVPTRRKTLQEQRLFQSGSWLFSAQSSAWDKIDP